MTSFEGRYAIPKAMSRILLHRVNGTDEEEQRGERNHLAGDDTTARKCLHEVVAAFPSSIHSGMKGGHQLFAFGEVN